MNTVTSICGVADACLHFCLNDGQCRKNQLGYVECACKENFSGERCELRFQPRSQKVMRAVLWILGVVALLILSVAVVWCISQRLAAAAQAAPGPVCKPIVALEPSAADLNFVYGRARRANSLADSQRAPLGTGFYYQEQEEEPEQGGPPPDSAECKTMFVGGSTGSVEAVAERAAEPAAEPARPSQEQRLAGMRAFLDQARLPTPPDQRRP